MCACAKCMYIEECVELNSGRASDSGSTGCEFNSYRDHFSIALGKLITMGLHSLDTGVNRYLTKRTVSTLMLLG